jgi:hypothetical protein
MLKLASKCLQLLKCLDLTVPSRKTQKTQSLGSQRARRVQTSASRQSEPPGPGEGLLKGGYRRIASSGRFLLQHFVQAFRTNYKTYELAALEITLRSIQVLQQVVNTHFCWSKMVL